MATEVKQLYDQLTPYVSEYLSALNICLVKGSLRPATLLEPLNSPLKIAEIQSICHDAGLLTEPWGGTKRLGPHLLIFDMASTHLVDELILDTGNKKLFGELLGYKCPGDVENKYRLHYFIDFIVPNPKTQQDNPFISYICNQITPQLLNILRQERKAFEIFFTCNTLATQVKLKISENGGPILIDEWL